MQADQNNYQPDKQFTDKGWREMLKTLDKEMPVQEKKRRGIFWFFPLLLLGVVASVWAFNSLSEKIEIAPPQEIVLDQNQNQINETKDLIKKEKESQTSSYNNQPTKNDQSKIDDEFPSVIELSNPLLPKVIEQIIPIQNREINEVKDPIAKIENEVLSFDPNFITIELQKIEELLIEEKEFFFEESIITNVPKSTKRKTEYGIYAGIVTDFANFNKPGLMTGTSVHFPLGKKFGLRTGLGYAQLQKELPFYFVGNQSAALSEEYLEVTVSAPPFSKVAVQSNTDFVLEKFHQLDLPVLLTYSPIKKMQFQLGVNASFLIKDQIKLIRSDLFINNAVNDDYSNFGVELDALDLSSISQNQYAEENYWTKLNISAVAGLAWKPTRRINLELQYHHGFFPILKSNQKYESNLFQGAIVNGFEVYDNPGILNTPDLEVTNRNFFEKTFSKENFIKDNYSLRFSIGYNF